MTVAADSYRDLELMTQEALNMATAEMGDVLGLGDVLGELRREGNCRDLHEVGKAAMYFISSAAVLSENSVEHRAVLALVFAMATLRFRIQGDEERAGDAYTKLQRELDAARSGHELN